jgi:hypothetical protein
LKRNEEASLLGALTDTLTIEKQRETLKTIGERVRERSPASNLLLSITDKGDSISLSAEIS